MSAGRSAARSLPALAARAQLGDRSALEELLRQLQFPLGEHIRGIVRDDDVAADALQEALILICRRLGTVRHAEWVRAWAYRVATREAFRSMKRSRRSYEQSIDDMTIVSDLPAEEHGVSEDELLAELPARLAALPVGAQAVLRLHYLQSLTQQEIAEALEIPLGTVKSRLAYGLMSLRKTWVSGKNQPVTQG